MGSQIISAITGGLSGYITGAATAIASGFNAAFVTTSGSDTVLSNLGEFGLTMTGLGLGVVAISWIVGKVF